MSVIALGLNHATAPIEIRERVSVPSDRLQHALNTLLIQPGVHAAAILSTCNRTDLYCRIDEPAIEASIDQWFKIEHGIMHSTVASYCYLYRAAAAVRHIMQVACGLDSMITGEPQILGQLKQAWHTARTAGALDAVMERLLQHSFAAAKQVRSETAIGCSTVSVAYAAVKCTQHIFDDFSQCTALLIGAGDTSRLVAKYLADLGIRQIIIANRSPGNAHRLAEHYHNALGTDLSNLEHWLAFSDIVVSSTASEQLLVTQSAMQNAIRGRRRRPRVMIDLAIPRDIEPSIGKLDDVYLYTVDDLGNVITEGLEARNAAAVKAELIVERHVNTFMQWVNIREAATAIQQLRGHGEAQRDELLALAKQRLASGVSPAKVVDSLAYALTNKWLHLPTQSLRQAAASGCEERIQLIQSLFSGTALSDSADDSQPF